MLLNPEQSQMLRELDLRSRAALVSIGKEQTARGPAGPGSTAMWIGFSKKENRVGRPIYKIKYRINGKNFLIGRGRSSILCRAGYAQLGGSSDELNLSIQLTMKGWRAFELLRKLDTGNYEAKPAAVKTDVDPFMQRFAFIME